MLLKVLLLSLLCVPLPALAHPSGGIKCQPYPNNATRCILPNGWDIVFLGYNSLGRSYISVGDPNRITYEAGCRKGENNLHYCSKLHISPRP